MSTVYRIYYTDPDTDFPHAKTVGDLNEALRTSELLRKDGFKFVTMVSEHSNMVGQTGVQSVQNGKLPNGDAYVYTKKDALSQRTKNLTDDTVVKLDDE